MLYRASNKLFQVFPVIDRGIKIERERVGWYLFAERDASAPVNRYQNSNPYIAQITGLDPTYRYARRFLSDRQREVFGRAAHLFRSVDKPLLLNIRAHESDYYVLHGQFDDKGKQVDVTLERIARDTVDELIEAEAVSKMGNSFFPQNQMNGGALPDTSEIRSTLRDMNAVTIAYNGALDRLERQRVSESEREAARRALEQWYHRVQEEHLSVRSNPPPEVTPHRNYWWHNEQAPLAGAGVSGNERLMGNEEFAIFGETTSHTYEQSPLLEDYPPARKKKPKDYQKQGYKAPILIPGKRRINLKDLK